MESRRKYVLVVDDSPEVREFFKAALELAGYRVESADDGAEALASLHRERPDAIVLDVVMPFMDGLQLLVHLRSDFAPPLPPVILCSGFDLSEEEALHRGAVRFLRKPVDPRDLIAAVGVALAGDRPDHQAIVAAQDHSNAARKEARAVSIKLLHDLAAQAPPGQPFSVHATALVAFAARYLTADVVVAALLREDGLRVIASSNPSLIAVGSDLNEALPGVDNVVETGSTLVLPDVTRHPSFAVLPRQPDQLRCHIAVPIHFDKRAIGVLCVQQLCACEIKGEDVALVQLLSRRGTSLLQAWLAGNQELPFRVGPGVAPRRWFEKTLDLELRLLHASGGSFELSIGNTAELVGLYRAVAGAADPGRLLAGLWSDGRVALFKRSFGTEARAQLAVVLAELREHGGLGAVGVIDLSAGVFGSFHAEDLLRLAEQALEDAIESATPLRRIVVEGASV
jgi:CheY-like chemotaxis protein